MKNKFFNRLFLLSTALITMSVNVWSEEVTDVINIVGYNGETTTSTAYKYGQDDADTSEGGIAVAACNYAGNGATRGNKTAIGTTSDCNFHIYNTEAYPGAIIKIEISAIGVYNNPSYGRYQNNMYASMGTSSQGSVSAVTNAIAGNLTQGSSSEESTSKFTWTFDASDNYTYFKLLTNVKFVSGTMKGAKIEVTYVTSAPTVQCTVTFLNNGQPVTSIGTNGVKTYNKGDALGTLPTQGDMTPCDASSNHFMGWYAGDPIREKQSTRPTLVTSATTVNDNMTLRAVWAREQ